MIGTVRPRSRAASNLLLVAASVGCALVAAEIGLHWLLPPPPLVEIVTDPDRDRRLEEERREAGSVDLSSEGGWKQVFVQTPTGRRMRANMRVRISDQKVSHLNVEIRTNALGYRNPEIGPKTRTRILFLGDSITMGHYLPEEETFVRRIEMMSQSTARPLETINAGIAAAGLQGELAILKETGLRTDPDVVVVDFYLNDVQASPGVFIRRLPAGLGWSRIAQYATASLTFLFPAGLDDDSRIDADELAAWRRDTARRLPSGPGDPLRLPAAFHRLVQENFDDWGSAWSDGAWERMRPLFLELRRQADAHGFRLAFVIFPVRPQVEASFIDDVPQTRLKALAAEIGTPVLDLLPPMRRARATTSEKLYYDICHPTSFGQAVIAAEIFSFLDQEVLR